MFIVLEMELQIYEHQYNEHDKLINSFKKQDISINTEFYKLSSDIYTARITKIFLREF